MMVMDGPRGVPFIPGNQEPNMAINSVTSSTSTNTQATQAARPQAQPDQAESARKASEEKAKTQASQQAEAPKPVVNAQGQTTGKIVNTIA